MVQHSMSSWPAEQAVEVGPVEVPLFPPSAAAIVALRGLTPVTYPVVETTAATVASLGFQARSRLETTFPDRVLHGRVELS
jgi:hypothetical protein